MLKISLGCEYMSTVDRGGELHEIVAIHGLETIEG